jgi:WD40 repeat protein
MLDYDRVVTCSREPVVKIFDLGGDGTPVAKFEGHEMAVNTIGVSSDKLKIASGARDCTVRIWDIENEK